MKIREQRPGRLTMLLTLVAALVVLAVATPAALAAGVDTGRNDIVKVGSDVIVAPGETVDSVTVFGGDATIEGTVKRTVVAVGGDIVIKDGATVGSALTGQDTSVVAIGGHTDVAPGAMVTGTTGAWEDLSSGEAVIAAAVAMSGVAIAGTILIALAFFAFVGALLTAAGVVLLVVWLVRRDGRKYTATQAGPAVTGPPEATVPAPV